MLDFVVVAMLLVLAGLIFSIYFVRFRKEFKIHRQIQLFMSVILLVSIIAFEVDLQIFSDWRKLAAPSLFYDSGTVTTSLYIHLVFAIPTPFVWAFVLFRALSNFSNPPEPGKHSFNHKFMGRIAIALMTMTAITGWVFYVLAFVC